MSENSLRPSDSSSSGTASTPVVINCYDLLPPGRLATMLWTLGTSLLHTGVVVGDKEYAFGGHDRPDVTGVYWTKPRTDPPGGAWRCEIVHGEITLTPEETDAIVREASLEFLGQSYNLLTRNCNHFTSHLCEKLTERPAPAYINRAASIGVALPCVVPAGWIEPPECEPDDDQSEEAPLTAVNNSTSSSANANANAGANANANGNREDSRSGGDCIPDEIDGDEHFSDSEDERRRRDRVRADRRKAERLKGKSMEW